MISASILQAVLNYNNHMINKTKSHTSIIGMGKELDQFPRYPKKEILSQFSLPITTVLLNSRNKWFIHRRN